MEEPQGEEEEREKKEEEEDEEEADPLGFFIILFSFSLFLSSFSHILDDGFPERSRIFLSFVRSEKTREIRRKFSKEEKERRRLEISANNSLAPI